MLIYGGEVSRGPLELFWMASVHHRYQGTDWLGCSLFEEDAFEYLGTSKVRNLGCDDDICINIWR